MQLLQDVKNDTKEQERIKLKYGKESPKSVQMADRTAHARGFNIELNNKITRVSVARTAPRGKVTVRKTIKRKTK